MYTDKNTLMMLNGVGSQFSFHALQFRRILHVLLSELTVVCLNSLLGI